MLKWKKSMKLSLPLLSLAALLVMLTFTVGTAGASARASQTASVHVPSVTGKRLDIAEATLQLSGLRFSEKGGGMFGIIVKHNWVVCIQSPAPGQTVSRGTPVKLFVSRPGNC